MLAIEREKFDFADSQIVNLRQFMYEGLKGIEVRERDKLIVDVLVELRKKSYDFEEVLSIKKETLDKLFADDVSTGWMIQTPEMICFHTWYFDKLREQEYTVDYSGDFVFKEQIAQ